MAREASSSSLPPAERAPALARTSHTPKVVPAATTQCEPQPAHQLTSNKGLLDTEPLLKPWYALARHEQAAAERMGYAEDDFWQKPGDHGSPESAEATNLADPIPEPTYLLRQTFLLALPLFRSTDIFAGAGIAGA